MNEDKWLSVAKAAARMNVSEGAVRNWIREKKIDSEKVDGRTKVYWPSVEVAMSKEPHLGVRGRPSKLAMAYAVDRPAPNTAPFKERLYSRIKKDGDGGCWLWTGSVQGGRPTFQSGPTDRFLVRQYVLKEETGLNGDSLRPGCGRSICVNPDHMVVKNGTIPLTAIEEIRRRWALHLAHDTTMKMLGDEFGVTRQRIEQIVHDVVPIRCKCAEQT